jgi:hypothetical protein
MDLECEFLLILLLVRLGQAINTQERLLMPWILSPVKRWGVDTLATVLTYNP